MKFNVDKNQTGSDDDCIAGWNLKKKKKKNLECIIRFFKSLNLFWSCLR